MAAKIAGKYSLRARNSDAAFQLFETDIDSEIDTDIEEDIEESFDKVYENISEDLAGETLNVPDTNKNPQKKNSDVAHTPPGWDDNNWVDGDVHLEWLPEFAEDSSFLVDIPDDADELYFLSLFMSDELVDTILLETNRYARTYIDKELAAGRLPPRSRFRYWPNNGITLEKLKAFIALTFYFGVVKKDNVKS